MWQGEVNDIISHLKQNNGCLFEDIFCPVPCGITLQRQFMAIHVKKCPCRKVACQYCHITGEHQFIKGKHKEQCPKFPIACPNNCDVGGVPRDDVEEHMKMCPLGLIQCEYHVVGCEERMARKDQKKHNKEKMEDHLSFTMHQLLTTQHDAVVTSDEHRASQQQMNKAKEILTHQVEPITSKLTQAAFQQKTSESSLHHYKVLLVSVLIALSGVFVYYQTVQTADSASMILSRLENDLAVTTEKLRSIEKELISVTKETTEELILKLYNTERDLNTTKQHLSMISQNVTIVEKKHAILNVNTDEALTKLVTKFQTKLNEIDVIMKGRVTTLEDNFVNMTRTIEQELLIFKKEDDQIKETLVQKLNTTNQQLTETIQNLTKTVKEQTTLAASIGDTLNNLQTKVTEVETATDKRITALQASLEKKILQLNLILWNAEISFNATKLSSGDQVDPVIIKMSEYTKKKRDRVDWYSDPFYTHHEGYKMCLNVEPAGFGGAHGTHLSVYLFFMNGPYDGQLTWGPKGSCKVRLLNQISNSEHHVVHEYLVTSNARVISGDRSKYASWGSAYFITHKDLHKVTSTCQYIKDDGIFFTVDCKVE